MPSPTTLSHKPKALSPACRICAERITLYWPAYSIWTTCIHASTNNHCTCTYCLVFMFCHTEHTAWSSIFNSLCLLLSPQALVTPLGALFWTLFDDPSCGVFQWLPHTNATVYFSIGGIVMMVPAIFLYNIG